MLDSEAAIRKGGVVVEKGIQFDVGIITGRINVMERKLVLRAEVVIYPGDPLVDIDDVPGDSGIVHRSRYIRKRHIVVDEVYGSRIEPVRRNDVSRERGAAERIDDRRGSRREIAPALLRRQDDRGAGAFNQRPHAFVARHEKGFVLADGSRYNGAELIAPQDVFRQRLGPEVSAGIQFVISQELKDAAAKLVGSRSELEVNVGSRISAVLCR